MKSNKYAPMSKTKPLIVIFSLISLMIIISCKYLEKSPPQPVVIAFGSSSMYQMDPYIKNYFEPKKIKFINASIGGQIIETMSAFQGSKPIYLTFNNNKIIGQGKQNKVEITQNNLDILQPKGYFKVSLQNGYKGILNLYTKTFTLLDGDQKPIEVNEPLLVNFKYFGYEKEAIHIFNIGKNNITMGQYSSDQVFNGIVEMVEFIQINGNHKFIICGFFVNREMPLEKKRVVLEVNSKLKEKYNNQYLDIQDWLTSKEIWDELHTKPTEADLIYQNKGELAPSLSSNPSHVNPKVSSEFSLMMIKKLKNLNYI